MTILKCVQMNTESCCMCLPNTVLLPFKTLTIKKYVSIISHIFEMIKSNTKHVIEKLINTVTFHNRLGSLEAHDGRTSYSRSLRYGKFKWHIYSLFQFT